MFNLEQSISEWRRQMGPVGVNNPEIVDELGSHLREDLARRPQAGESERNLSDLRRVLGNLGLSSGTIPQEFTREMRRNQCGK